MAKNLEFRSLGDVSAGEGRTVYGLAAPFGPPANIASTDNGVDTGVYSQWERIERGAFKRSIAERGHKVKLLFNHEVNMPIGKAVKLEERSEGLYFEAEVADTDLGNEVLSLVRQGVIDGFSIGFQVRKSEDVRTGGRNVRVMQEIALHEISLVTFPAYNDAEVQGVRSISSEESSMSENVTNEALAGIAEGEVREVNGYHVQRTEQVRHEVREAAPMTYAEGLNLIPSDTDVRELHGALMRREGKRIETRAAVLSSVTGATKIGQGSGVQERRIRRLAEVGGMPAEVLAGPAASLGFPVFGADTAEIAAEGALKAEYDSITAGSATPQTIATWTDVSNQTLMTYGAFAGKLQNEHAVKIAAREDKLVYDTIYGTAGIQDTVGTLSPQTVLESAAKVAANGAEPNVIVVNPADIDLILGSSLGTGGDASPEFRAWAPRIYGMDVYVSTAVAAGEALLGAFNSGARFVVGQRPTVMSDPYTGMKSNLTTIRSEEAVAVAVEVPSLFCTITAV